MVSSNQVAGIPSLLWCIREMCSNKFLSSSEITSLAEILPVIFDNANYHQISLVNKDAISFSMVRARCVELSQVLIDNISTPSTELGRILSEAEVDPLPEVRFAAHSHHQAISYK